ncbi:hypothetical protein EDD16DRAFT_1581524 [Pisolithus croceorrhizus]|nr:hypothetical protein EDD16DRAFT_1581524 [Pisolithus croceorrhizus]
MRRMLISRISRRVLAEHHLALSKSLGRDSVNSKDPHSQRKRSVDKCAHLLRSRSHGIEDDNGEIIPSKGWPKVVVEGQLNARFAYIREHLEPCEPLGSNIGMTTTLPPIFATIVAGKDDVRGVKATVAEQVGGWQATEEKGDRNAKDPERGAGIAPHQRMGLGLPMSNIFATYFGGSLQLVSLDGLGTDAYLQATEGW